MPIHPTAIVSDQAKIDPTAEIGPYVIIEDEVSIGPGCRISPHVYINGYTTIGANNEIHTGAVLGDTPQDLAYKPCRSYLRIGDNNVIREFCSIHRGTAPQSETVIGNGCYIMGYSHIGHNCRLGDNVKLANMAALSGYVEVGDGAFVSGYSAIHQFVRIGRLAMIGGLSRIGMDVPPMMTCIRETEVIGVNIVGMRRAGYDPQQIAEVKNAYKILYRSGMTFRKAVAHLSETAEGALSREIVEFVSHPSKRGIAGGADPKKELPSGV